MSGWDHDIKRTFGHCGEEVFVGRNCVFARPERVTLKGRCRIDPFCLVTAGIEAEINTQICSHAVVEGRGTLRMAPWSWVAYRALVLTGSDDFVNSLVNAWWCDAPKKEADVELSSFSGLNSGAVAMPGTRLPVGCVIGLNSVVSPKDTLLPWYIHATQDGKLVPVKPRDRERILEMSEDPKRLRHHA